MISSNSDGFDVPGFRGALGHFATGVAVVTASTDEGAVVGMTMSSFNSVSLDPPLVLFSVARTAYSLPAMCAARAFGINILGRHQESVSNRFARPLADKWDQVDCHITPEGAPLLGGVIAHFECVPHVRYDGGDHEIFLARVIRYCAPFPGEPLIFFRGKYHALATAAVGQ